MNDTKKVRLGSISILMTVILLCVTVLAVLSVTSAKAADAMTSRLADRTKAYYALQSEGQRYVADLLELNNMSTVRETLLAEGTQAADGSFTRTFEQDGLVLTIVFRLDDDRLTASFLTNSEWEEDKSLNLLP